MNITAIIATVTVRLCEYFCNSQLVFFSPSVLATLASFLLALLSGTIFVANCPSGGLSDRAWCNKFCWNDAVRVVQVLMVIGTDAPGFEKTVAPPNAPSNILMGVKTKRGPISTSVVLGGPLG